MSTLDELADRLHSAAIHVLKIVRARDRSTPLTPARLSVLSVLVVDGPATVGELAMAEGVRSPTMSGLVRGLENDGLVLRCSRDRDRRASVISATERGREVMAAGRRARADALRERLARLPDDDRKLLEVAVAVLLGLDQAGSRASAPKERPTQDRPSR